MPSKQVQFDTYSFPSAAAAKRAFKAVRDRYIRAGVVTDPEDDRMLRALVHEHRNREEKVGPGIDHFVVQSNASLGARGGNYGIWIKQIGRVELVDFGYGGVIDWMSDPSNETRERRRVERALRNEIRPITDAFLESEIASGKPLISSLSGFPIDAGSPIDVIHTEPRWGELIDVFLTGVGGASEVETAQQDHSLGEQLVDDGIRRAWIQFHTDAARLGLATPGENSRRSRSD